jgi:hypothetical protein
MGVGGIRGLRGSFGYNRVEGLEISGLDRAEGLIGFVGRFWSIIAGL